MKPVPVTIYDGTNTTTVNRINAPAGSVDPNGVLDLGLGVKVYRALLTQTNTDAPVATVLENTLGGEVVWTRGNLGTYAGTLAGASIVLQGSSDNEGTWVTVPNSTQAITADGSWTFELDYIRYAAFRTYVTMTAGQLQITKNQVAYKGGN